MLPKSKAQTKPDSATITQEFLQNAKPLLDSLTALHFARLEIRVLNEQIQRHQQERDQMTHGYIQAQEQLGRGSLDQLSLQQQLVLERQKKRRARWENWGWRTLAAYLIYRKMCPSCRF